MKKFLSLVLALVMTMSLVTVSAGAKEFTDDDAITYDEAITVISTIGVVDGYEDGSFNPTGLLTRQAAAKIICNLILGPTTAEALRADAAPFPDVPVSNPMSGYIAYCAQQGIINGYPNGNFNPGGNLTGNAFMKMLLGALGYDSAREGFTGDNWSIQVAKLALGIGLDNGLEGEFDGSKTVNREEAALYALNMIQADLVEYETVVSTVVNGQVINVGSSIAKTMTWKSSSTKKDYIKADGAIQFAEEYFTKLERRPTTDDFGRPTHTWVYDKVEQGEYLDTDLIVAEYTKKVTYGDLFDAIGKAALDNCDVVSYVDGETGVNTIAENDIYRGNKDKAGETGKGTLTQVFIDTDKELITIAVINTYLAKAAADYDTKKEEARLTVYQIEQDTSTDPFIKTDDKKEVISIDKEDFAGVEDIEKDDLFLVTVAKRQIQTLEAPEIVAEATINSFKKEDYVNSEGTQYDYADTAMYDEEVLDQYTSLNGNNINLKDLTYNIILDPYGYLIGVERNEDPDQYLFLTGVDQGNSNLISKNADANAVFLDGTMATITIDTDKSKVVTSSGSTVAFDKSNINAQRNNWSMVNTWCTYTVNTNNVYTVRTVPLADKAEILGGANKLKVGQYHQDISAPDATPNYRNSEKTSAPFTKEIGNKRTSLTSWYDTDANTATNFQRVYGTDKTVYLNLELKAVWTKDTTGSSTNWIVDDVESVTTGVKNVKFTVEDLDTADNNSSTGTNKINEVGNWPKAEIYSLYNKDGDIIAAVTLNAENEGVSSTWAYITSEDVEWEGYNQSGNNKGGTTGENEWTWKRTAIVNGEETELIERGDTLDILNNLKQGEWYELKFDGNGNVRKEIWLYDKLTGNDASLSNSGDKGYVSNIGMLEEHIAGDGKDNYLVHDWTTVDGLTHESGTLWTDTARTARLRLTNSTKIVLVTANDAGKNVRSGKSYKNIETYSGLEGMDEALDDMNVFYGDNRFMTTALSGADVYSGHDAETVSNVEISSVVSSDGDSRIIIITEHAPEVKKNNPNGGNNNKTEGDRLVGGEVVLEFVDRTANVDNAAAVAKIVRLLTNLGYTNISYNNTPAAPGEGKVYAGFVTARDSNGNNAYFDVQATFFYTINVGKTVVATVAYGSDYTLRGANYKSDGGTGIIGNSGAAAGTVAYTAYGNVECTGISAKREFTTGWFQITNVDTLKYTDGTEKTVTITGTSAGATTVSAQKYFKVGEKITATTESVTVAAGGSATATLKSGNTVLGTGTISDTGTIAVNWTPSKDTVKAAVTLSMTLVNAGAPIPVATPDVNDDNIPEGVDYGTPRTNIPSAGGVAGVTYNGTMPLHFDANASQGSLTITAANCNVLIAENSLPAGVNLVKPNQISWRDNFNGSTVIDATIEFSIKVAATQAVGTDPVAPERIEIVATFGNTYVAPGGEGGGSEGGGGEEPDPSPTTFDLTATALTTEQQAKKGAVTLSSFATSGTATGVEAGTEVSVVLTFDVGAYDADTTENNEGATINLTVTEGATVKSATVKTGAVGVTADKEAKTVTIANVVENGEAQTGVTVTFVIVMPAKAVTASVAYAS